MWWVPRKPKGRNDIVKTTDDQVVIYEMPIVDTNGYALGTLRVMTLVEQDWRTFWTRYIGVSAHLAGDEPPAGNEDKT